MKLNEGNTMEQLVTAIFAIVNGDDLDKYANRTRDEGVNEGGNYWYDIAWSQDYYGYDLAKLLRTLDIDLPYGSDWVLTIEGSAQDNGSHYGYTAVSVGNADDCYEEREDW